MLEKKPDGIINECVNQIAVADRIIINKTDLVTPEELLELKGAIRSVNAAALTVDTVKAAIDLDFVLDLGAFDVSEAKVTAELETAAATAAAAAAAATAGEADGRGHGHGHGHGHGKSAAFPKQHAGQHDLSVKTVTFEEIGNLDGGKLDAWLAAVLWEHTIPGEGGGGSINGSSSSLDGNAGVALDSTSAASRSGGGGGGNTNVVGDGGGAAVDVGVGEKKNHRMEILRMKGVASIAGDERRAVVQGVHELYDKDYTTPWALDEPRLNRLIFIGRHLDGPALHRSFKALLAAY